MKQKQIFKSALLGGIFVLSLGVQALHFELLKTKTLGDDKIAEAFNMSTVLKKHQSTIQNLRSGTHYFMHYPDSLTFCILQELKHGNMKLKPSNSMTLFNNAQSHFTSNKVDHKLTFKSKYNYNIQVMIYNEGDDYPEYKIKIIGKNNEIYEGKFFETLEKHFKAKYAECELALNSSVAQRFISNVYMKKKTNVKKLSESIQQLNTRYGNMWSSLTQCRNMRVYQILSDRELVGICYDNSLLQPGTRYWYLKLEKPFTCLTKHMEEKNKLTFWSFLGL